MWREIHAGLKLPGAGRVYVYGNQSPENVKVWTAKAHLPH
jgi:hypothetical protein